jgi:two-component system invasion response regulator UvrY
MNIIVCDDHPVVREGLTRLIRANLEVTSVNEVDNGQALLDLVRNQTCDLVLLDVGLPGRSGLDVLQQLKQERPRTAVLMLSVHAANVYAVRALRLGASGYLTKSLAADEIIKAVRAVAAGHKYVTPDVAERLAEDLERPLGRAAHETLSDREFEVLCLLAEGRSVRQISSQLFLSYNTVSTYRSRLLSKLCLKTDAEIVRYALHQGIVE